jgi:kynurenine formamidase
LVTHQPTIETVRELARKHRNWGRWGEADELGTMNLVTPEKIAEAARLVRDGKVFPLALPLDSNGPQNGAFGRVNPIHLMLQDGGDIVAGAQDHLAALRYTDDAVFMPLQCATQWDALAHIFFDGKMYNGRDPSEVTSTGARTNSITAITGRAVGRGVLLDVARHLGKAWLEVGERIEGDDLDACAQAQGVEVQQGDFVLVRTGGISRARHQGHWDDAYTGGDAPGLALSCADYLCSRDIAAICTDTWGVDARPNETVDVFQPLHAIMLVNAGIHFGEMWDLDSLAEDCVNDRRYEFMVVAPPLTITGAVGSPVTPLAIK